MVGTGTGPVLLVQVLILGGCVVDTVWSYWGEVLLLLREELHQKQRGGWPEVAGGRFFRVKQGLVCRWVPQVPVTGVGG